MLCVIVPYLPSAAICVVQKLFFSDMKTLLDVSLLSSTSTSRLSATLTRSSGHNLFDLKKNCPFVNTCFALS